MIQQVGFLFPDILDLPGQSVILSAVNCRIVLRFILVKVCPDLAVNLIDLRNVLFKFFRRFHFKLFRAFVRLPDLLVSLLQIFFQIMELLFCLADLVLDTHRLIQQCVMVPLPLLPLRIPCKDVLLLADQVRRRYQFFGRIRVISLFVGILLFLVGDPPDGQTLLVQSALFFLQLCQLRPNSDDVQQGVCLLLIGCLHKLREI